MSDNQGRVIEEYRSRLAKEPDDPAWLYLYAQAITGRRTAEAVGLLEKAVAKKQRIKRAVRNRRKASTFCPR